ncbi:glycosyltransferase family 39 protein [Massilia sp. 9096]|uniref:ArnT family glycosyltransferase n=1 Tax=Massilia sp. 9096 TaxID=1500894 RepID=UPI00056BD8AD|nr:glycosyltransferase family 39 protein [Massilia sp. 9096]
MSDEHLAASPGPVDAFDAHGAPVLRRRSEVPGPLLAVLAYVVAYLVLRLGEHGGLERDEAEMVYLARDLRPGYGAQPPLYTWLQWLAFQAFGPDRFALALVKGLSLGAIYMAMYRAALPWVGRAGALAAAASLLLLPQIGWEALRIQTHSVLMMALACGLLWAYGALLARPVAARYAAFGLVAGLGLLAKYNFAILLGGMVGASLLVHEHRVVLWHRRAWIAALVAMVVFLPHAAWMAQHLDAAFGGTLHKMQDGGEHAPYLRRVLHGALGLLSALAAFVAVPAAAFAFAAWSVRADLASRVRTRARDARMARARDGAAGRFFLWLYVLCLAQLGLLVLLGVVGTIKERWLMPVLFSLPLALLVWLPALRRQAPGGRLLRIGAVAGVATLALLPARIWLGPAIGKTVAAHYPYAPLAQALAQRYPGAQAVVANDVMLAGNLLFARAEAPSLQTVAQTVLLDDLLRERRPLRGEVLLVTQDGYPQGLGADFRAAYPAARPLSRARIELPLRFGGRGMLGFTVERMMLPAPGPAPVRAQPALAQAPGPS